MYLYTFRCKFDVNVGYDYDAGISVKLVDFNLRLIILAIANSISSDNHR